ncbi:MAG: 4-hydroxy-3-methylbut-2-enyl diphosphate reductase [Eubacteriales bacterium]|nr:4-hydroxy-3-methylbut-2-enyl diphosphate reductase [Eubacteriales bacterium]
MEVIVAKSAGFCFGVQRAVKEVERLIREGVKPVWTYGPIIHNEQVVNELAEKGVRVIRSEEELEQIHEGTIVIRSHGVPRRLQEKMEATGAVIVDATCPFVKKIHRIAEKAGQEGKTLVIAGNPDHPEVQGIMGWTEGTVFAVETPEEAANLPITDPQSAILVAQTTFNKMKFKSIVEKFKESVYHEYVVDTVCSATDERQTETRDIARTVDAMIVIGGRHSSNTQKLYQICKAECSNSCYIETLVDLDVKPFQTSSRVGITAGASTPNIIIEEVAQHVRKL